MFSRGPGGVDPTLSWDAPTSTGGTSIGYDTLRSDEATGFDTGGTCIESNDMTDQVAVDGQAPPEGAAWFYLTRARNGCPGSEGIGTLGQGSDGSPRQGLTCP